jgi:gliding motility-associatede transport system auxiliary component
MKATRKTHLQYKIQHIIFIFLLLCSIGLAGWLSNEYNLRSDWTAGKRHSLSEDTTQLLEQLDFAVELRSYQPDNPQLTKAINEILNRYKTNKADFSFKLINPDIFIEQAKADHIQRYGQTIIDYQDRSERIEKISEEAITNALIRLQRGSKPKLHFLTQHGERSLTDTSPLGYSQLVQKLINKGFDVKPINLLSENLSLENSVLVLSSITKPLLENEQQKILQYIKQGGQLLWLQDPVPDTSQLKLLLSLNIRVIDGIAVENNPEVSRMLKLNHPAIIPILEYRRHPITEKMQYFTLFTSAAALTAERSNRKNKPEWLTTDLLLTSENSWSETGDILLGIEFNPERDLPGPLSIGIAQQRQIEHDNKKNSQRIVIIGDSDFIANNNIGNGANLDFILNTFNWLTNDDKLISIAPKNAPDLQLKLSAPLAAVLGLTFLIALPLLFFISGAIIWFKRQKK